MTKDRKAVVKIIDKMLGNPMPLITLSGNEYNSYDSDKAYDQLETLMSQVRVEAIGWVWALICTELDNNNDPRQYSIDRLVEEMSKELND